MITFIRHAQTEHNINRLFHGQLDINLSEKGINDTIEKSKDFPQDFDVCFCSPLKRTKQTAEILMPNIKKNYDDRIMERNMGEWEGTIITDEKMDLLRKNETPPKGESIAQIDTRVAEFLEMLKKSYSDKNIIVITHAGIIHSIGRVLSQKIESVNHLEMIKFDI